MQVATQAKIILILSVLATQFCYSQNNQLVFDHLGLDAGFTAKEARDIVTAPNGMVWISSNNGLVRYDSKRFKFYKHVEGDSNSISANLCTYLEIDKGGRIWISCKDNVDVFDPAAEKFRHLSIPFNHKTAKWLKPFDMNMKYDAAKDIMWIPTKNGLFFCRGGSLKVQSVSSITNDSTLISDPVFDVLPFDADHIWIASGLKFVKLNTRSGAVEKYIIPKRINNTVNDEQFSYIKCMWLDKNQTLWLGTWRNGLIGYNTINKKFSQYFFNDATTNTVYDIKQLKSDDQDDLLYLSTFGNGFCTFNTTAGKFKSYKSPYTADNSGIRGDTYSMHTDTQGSALWIGSESGLHKLDRARQLFKSIDLSSLANGSDLLPVNAIAIEKSATGKDENIWIKIPDKGTYICNLANGSILPTPSRLAQYIENAFDFFSLFIDSKNRLWINNNKYGLICYDIETDKIVVPENRFFVEKTEWVNTFFEDKRGVMWFGARNGLFFWDETAKTVVAVQHVNMKLKNENLAMAVEGITEDAFNCLWYTTGFSNKKNACIGKYDYLKNTSEIIFNEIRDKGILSRPADFGDIAITANKKIFVSDNNNGLLWFSVSAPNPVLKKAADNSALNTNEVSSVIAGNNNNIWCNTNFGIALYNTDTETFTNYSYTNYAIGQKMRPTIFLSKQSGELYMGQSNAINHINTSLVKDNINSSDLVFTEIKLFSKTYKAGEKAIADGDELIFTHDQNTISVEFALLSYTNSNENLYSWKLEGLEKDWNTSKSNVASYYQLSPGSYTLLVKAANNNGVWSAKIRKLHIVIKSPFYATWWFILLSILIVIAAIYYFVQQKIRRIKERYQLRNKIASDLHDEIGSTLTSISILSDVSQQAMEHRPLQAKEMLQQIASQSKTIQQNMSDIVWSIRPDNEKIENLVVRMREFAAQTLEPLNINTTIAADDTLVNKILPMQYRKDILLIYKEAINNIAKHANATTAKILLTSEKGKMVLSIADNGRWKVGYTGTGTKTMQERATAIGGKLLIANTEAGTQILLTLPIT